jgi:hypothetical protein
MMMWLRPKLVRTRLTLWYVFVLGVLLVVFAAGASFVLVWHMSAQLKRQAVQDLETVEGLLYFGGDRPRSGKFANGHVLIASGRNFRNTSRRDVNWAVAKAHLSSKSKEGRVIYLVVC